MTDSDVLNWIQENMTQLSITFGEQFVIGYLDDEGITRYQYGESLRDCVMKASAKNE